jgi:tetratricopeptide (TPR) repeat protein
MPPVADRKKELSWDLGVVRGRLAMDQEREAAAPLLRALEAGERSLASLKRTEWRLLRGVPLIERLLAWSAEKRYQDPQGMIRLAHLALCLVQQLSPRRYGSKLLADLHARVWTELANAYRVADKLSAAEPALSQAATWFCQGSGNTRLTARVAEVAASFASDEGRFADAIELATVAILGYQNLGEISLMGKALIKKGIYAGYDDRPEEGIAWIIEGLKKIDASQAPALVLAAVHAVLWNLVEAGACREAGELLSLARALYQRDGTFLNRLRLRWLEGRIALGLDDLETAAEHLNAVRQGFRLADQSFDAALASLDLALVYTRQGRTQEIIALAGEMIATFRALKIGREAIASLAVLRKACGQPAVSAERLAGHIHSCAALVAELQRGRRPSS